MRTRYRNRRPSCSPSISRRTEFRRCVRFALSSTSASHVLNDWGTTLPQRLESLRRISQLVPDPVPGGDPAGFDAALAELADRVGRLAPRLSAAS
jgi:hypothetical protein